MRRHLVTLAGLVISAAALYLVVQTIDLGEAVGIVTRAAPLPLVGIVGVVAVQVALRSFRWSLLLPIRPEGRPIPARRLAPPLLVGYLGNTVLPARLGEAMRAVIVARREPVGVTEAVGSVLVERFIDVVALAAVAFGAALLVGAPDWATRLLGVAAGVGIIGLVILLTTGLGPVIRLADRLGLAGRERLRGVVVRFADTVGGPSRRPVLAAAAGISLVSWLVDAGAFWLAAQAVGVELSYAAAILVAGVTVLGTAIPSAPGYVGTFELAAAGIAGALGVPPTPALAMAVVAHLATSIPYAAGGAVSLALMGASLGEVAHAAEARPDA
jgi:glycosyltransferase 2 family protein